MPSSLVWLWRTTTVVLFDKLNSAMRSHPLAQGGMRYQPFSAGTAGFKPTSIAAAFVVSSLCDEMRAVASRCDSTADSGRALEGRMINVLLLKHSNCWLVCLLGFVSAVLCDAFNYV